MAEYAPDQNFKHPVCRGSWALGNNCKVCERCQATHPSRAGTQLLTNPKHTSSDLVEWCSQDLPCARYQALEAEIERLREAISAALRCTPQAKHGAIIYDCGDPWEILTAALAGDSHD